MGWLIFFSVLLLLAVLPLGVRVRYDSGGVLLRLILGPVKLTLIPAPKKKKKQKREQEQPEPEKKAQKQKPKRKQTLKQKPKQPPGQNGSEQPRKQQSAVKREKELPKPPQPPQEHKKLSGGSLKEFLPLVKTALELLNAFRQKIRIDRLYLRLILGDSDPCDLAVNYGKVWTAVGNLMPRLERIFVIKKRDVEVECDFTASDTTVIARVDITITLGRLLALAAVYGIRALKEYIIIQKKRKGGAVT